MSAQSASAAAKAGRLLAGRVVRTKNIGVNEDAIVHVRLPSHTFSKFLNKYFQESDDHWLGAVDRKRECRQGDLVLVRGIEWRHSRDICHQVERVIERFGHAVDPVTDRTGSAMGDTMDVFGEEYALRSKIIDQKLGAPDYHLKTAVEKDTDDGKGQQDDFSVK